MVRKAFRILFISVFIPIAGFAQQLATIKGSVSDIAGTPLFSASVAIQGKPIGTVTDSKGQFSIPVPANEQLILVISHLGLETYTDTLKLKPGEVFLIEKSLAEGIEELGSVTVYGVHERENSLVRIDIHSFDQLPNSSGNIESILKTLPGVVSGNELSSQYSVRGGSFDENLIYVNDIEIYRPLLVQSAQQEGLSFINPSMVSSIQFSAGGFDAQYGDKLSSVLDIKYKQPTDLRGSASISLLGASAQLEGASKNRRFTMNTGARYKTTNYLLKTLDTKGDYKPSFTDIQTYLTYDLSKKLELSFLGNYATNRFYRQPTERETSFGSLSTSFNFTAYYEGQEIDRFNTYLGALALNYHPTDKVSLKFISSGFRSNEEISYDILKEYFISQSGKSSSGKNDTLVNIGIGASLDHARNKLASQILSFEHKGFWMVPSGNIKWGFKLQNESIDDQLQEWEYLDSSGYSLPYSDENVSLFTNVHSKNKLNTMRYSSFIQHTANFSGNRNQASITYGARAQYWSYNREVTISPRANFTIKPFITPRVSWHISGGLYYQPPFYKELRDETGKLYTDLKAQRALHLVVGSDFSFKLWDRPFLFSSEIYYKNLTHLIVYKLRDVQLQFLPQYQAKGYAKGLDFKIYGEFVPGTESWFSLSFLSTEEDIYNDYVKNSNGSITYPGYYRRPTDQAVSFSMFFQDYLPSNPNYKVHLMVIYGTGLPYSGPSYSRPADTYSLGAYRRMDIGFSRLIIRKDGNSTGLKTIWISAEILNVLDAPNKVSYDWLRTVQSEQGVNTTFGIPNYLTGRILNVKITADF